MKTIWKFQLKTEDIQTIIIPRNSKFLSVQMQNKIPCLWALVNPDEETIKRKIEIFGTGIPMDENPRTFIDTFQLYGGQLVFHVFLQDES